MNDAMIYSTTERVLMTIPFMDPLIVQQKDHSWQISLALFFSHVGKHICQGCGSGCLLDVGISTLSGRSLLNRFLCVSYLHKKRSLWWRVHIWTIGSKLQALPLTPRVFPFALVCA